MKAVIFDFDGTLGDTQQGILATAQEVLHRMGRGPADETALAATIGGGQASPMRKPTGRLPSTATSSKKWRSLS